MNFEHMAARFVASAASHTSEHIKSLVFASPLSARSPDLSMLWHPEYRKKHGLKILLNQLMSICISCLKGTVKLFGNINPFGYAIYGEIRGALFAVTASCGSVSADGSYKTPYIKTDADDGLFVFGPVNKCGSHAVKMEALSFLKKCAVLYTLINIGVRAFTENQAKFSDRALLLLDWLVWVLGLSWLFYYYLESALSKIVEENNIQKIGYVHEMHSYARVVWRVARQYKAEGYTIQHAAISEGKRWYFAYPEEKENGLALPDVMYIYNSELRSLLSSCFSQTRFYLGCSFRYSAWKLVEPVKYNKERGCLLFVGALAGFDNATLISTIRRLIEDGDLSITLKLRLHPLAQISFTDKAWLKRAIKKKQIELSKNNTLETDLQSASFVVGMSTTVLEEALLLGRPVVQLINDDYLEFIDLRGAKGVLKRNHEAFCIKDLGELQGPYDDFHYIRNKLGLNQPLVTYKKLFSV